MLRLWPQPSLLACLPAHYHSHSHRPSRLMAIKTLWPSAAPLSQWWSFSLTLNCCKYTIFYWPFCDSGYRLTSSLPHQQQQHTGTAASQTSAFLSARQHRHHHRHQHSCLSPPVVIMWAIGEPARPPSLSLIWSHFRWNAIVCCSSPLPVPLALRPAGRAASALHQQQSHCRTGRVCLSDEWCTQVVEMSRARTWCWSI